MTRPFSSPSRLALVAAPLALAGCAGFSSMSAGCCDAALASTGGAGLLYCFAAR